MSTEQWRNGEWRGECDNVLPGRAIDEYRAMVEWWLAGRMW